MPPENSLHTQQMQPQHAERHDAAIYRLCTVVTLKYDEPEVENIARGRNA